MSWCRDKDPQWRAHWGRDPLCTPLFWIVMALALLAMCLPAILVALL